MCSSWSIYIYMERKSHIQRHKEELLLLPLPVTEGIIYIKQTPTNLRIFVYCSPFGQSISMSHIAVERNRRRQMNEHLKVLRSLTPCFYIKRGDQASIIGGVIEFIKELHQVLQSLEAKKRRKSLSPSPGPGTPRPVLQLSPQSECSFGPENFKEIGTCCNSPVADVEAKIAGSNVVLRTVSKRIPGQIVRIINVLEKFSLEILHLNISSMEDTVLHSFVIKIGLECQLSLEELAMEVQQSFCPEIVYSKQSEM